MKVEMMPVEIDEIPGMRNKSNHEEWARSAVEEFAASGMDAAKLTVPKLGVSKQTAVGLLRRYGVTRGVKVRVVNRKDAKGTYLIRKEALDAQR